MLEKLEQLLKDENYYHEKELKDVYATTCPYSTIKVLDFDLIKEKFCQKYGIKDFCKSNDLLIILKNKNALHLIEMKSCKSGKASKFNEEYKSSTKLRDKNIHSIFLILSLATQYSIDEDFYSCFFHNANPKKINIRTSVLCDLPPSEMAFITISTLNTSGISFKSVLAGEVEIINCQMFTSFFSTAN